MHVEVPPVILANPSVRKREKKEFVPMRRIIEVLTVAPPRACKARYLCASAAFMAALLVIGAAPVKAQGDSGLTYGPNGPYYGPYDYCV